MNLYIDSESFSTATTVYLDSLLSEVAPDGYYSDNVSYRRQVDGILIDILICPSIDTVSITGVGQTFATFNGNLISNGGDTNAVRGFVYGTSPNPTTANSVITDTIRTQGTYSLNVTGLSSGATYYVKAYSIVFGNTIYGDELSFTPVAIDTVSITEVGETTATFNGDLISDGGDVNAVRGFVYGTSTNPTTANSVITDTVTGQGDYSLNATGLTAGVTYYVRAYTIAFGNTVYGDQLNFTLVVIVPCDGTGDSGGLELKDQYVNLNSTGGEIVFLFDPLGQVDKLEIYHGLPQNGGVNKKATTSQSAINTYTLAVNTSVDANVGAVYTSTSGASYTVYATKTSGTGTSLVVTCPTFTTPITALTKISGTGDSSIDFTSFTQTYGGNYGPFDNIWGTLPSNSLPDDPWLPVDQFVGTYKGVVPTRESEYTSDTGYVIPSMTVGGRTYDQVVWWKYTTADYLINSVATIRATGGSDGTLWYSIRVCP
jgi:hypothetical protein